ncbi:MAG: hypothetical protein HC896_05330 [Bacteroidales bacterium]|nr:hypothetical protein [Bacteroidales bacterium]
MIAGVWVEGLYLATQVAAETESNELLERIGEQKKILDQLLLILKNYQKQDVFYTKHPCARTNPVKRSL